MIILYIPSVDHYHQDTDSTYSPSEIHDEESTGSFNCIITELKYRIHSKKTVKITNLVVSTFARI